MTKYRLTTWALAALMLTACQRQKDESRQNVIVKTTKPTITAIQGKEDFSFITKPWRTSELSFRVSGPVHRLDAYAGSKYNKGSIIAEIDPRDFRISKARAAATFQQMEAEYRRVTSLYHKNNIPASLYERTKADYAAAKAAYESADNALADTRLIAPFNGYIGEVFIEKYQDVKAAQPVVTLIDIARLKIEIFVTQDVAKAAQQAGEIDVCFDNEPETPHKAKVIEVSKGTMSNNLSYMLTAMLPNSNGQWLAGMSGKARLPLTNSKQHQGVAIPLSALCHRQVDGDFVWVVNPKQSKVSKRQVKRGKLLEGGKVSIISGLGANEEIATTGLRFLSDGMTVEISKKK